jgi:hypothetical protein
MNFLLAMLLADQVAAKLVHLTFMALTGLALYAFGRQHFSRQAGFLAAALYVTLPLVAWEASTANIDLALACYCFLTVVATHQWWRERQLAWLRVAGLMAGFALSTKLNAVILLIPVGMVVAGVVLLDRRPGPAHRWLPLLHFGGMMLIAAVPWPLLRFVQTGNPVFPFLNTIFKSPQGPATYGSFSVAAGGNGPSLDWWLRLPWDVTFNSSAFVEALPSSIVGLGLLALPLLVLSRPISKDVKLLGALVLTSCIIWALTLPNLRYFLPILPIVYVLVGHALASFDQRGIVSAGGPTFGSLVKGLTLTWIVDSLPLLVATYWGIPERIPYRVAFGLESREHYLSRLLLTYDALQFIGRSHAGRATYIFLVSPEVPLVYAPGLVETHHSRLAQPLLRSTDLQQAATLAQERGITHLLINRRGLQPDVDEALVLQRSFLDQYTDIMYAKSNVEVYRLLGAGNEPSEPGTRPAMQLLADPGFEALGQDSALGWHAYGQPGSDDTGSQSRGGKTAVRGAPDSGYAQTVPILTGRIYTFSSYARSDAAGSNVRLQVNWEDEQGHMVDLSIAVFTTSADWRQHDLTAMAPPGSVRANVQVSAYSGQVWLDDCSLVART